MSERIYKLQPDRTVHLRGFDSFAAATAIHSASATGFKVSGTFRDPADFAVAVLYDADNFYEHPSIRYLPDFDFSGLTLEFDLHYSNGLQPIDSPKYNWIDWATLDCIQANGSPGKVRLWDYSTLAGSSFPAASTTLNVIAGSSGATAFDHITLWFQNLAFDYIAPAGKPSIEFQFFAGGTDTVHSITVGDRTYSHTESDPAGESSAAQAAALIDAINSAGDDYVTASSGSVDYAVKLTIRTEYTGPGVAVSASDDNAGITLRLITAKKAAANIADQINAADWMGANPTHGLLASVSGAAITVTAARYGSVSVSGATVEWLSGAQFVGLTAGSTFRIGTSQYIVAAVESPTRLTLTEPADEGGSYLAPRGGVDGNLLSLYTTSKTPTLTFDTSQVQLTGGSSDVTWHCRIEFTSQNLEQIRQCWLTFAPALVNGDFPATEWEATFSNWSVTGNEEKRALQVAGPGSVRLEETDRACTYTGAWSTEAGFYSNYFARATNDPVATASISYICQMKHDLYVGTSLYSDRGVVGIQVDDDAEVSINCHLETPSAVVTRRLIKVDVAPGKHTVKIRVQQSGWFYFDFLEAAVKSDIPSPLEARPDISPALDFDTDHTYKLSPARLHWIFDQLGYAGPMNEYLGVFWWNQRAAQGVSLSSAVITFTGTFLNGDTIFLTLNETSLGKTVFPGDTNETIASHFALYINGAFVGARAAASGPTLTITGRSPAPAYTVSISISATSADGHVAVTTPTVGSYGSWVIDDSAADPLNRATRDWHADFYAHCATRGRDIVTACSLELVNPPAGYAAKFPDGTEVATDTGFGSLVSNHCAAGSSKMIAYQKSAYKSIAGLQAAAGLTPWVQFGEFLWWYFEEHGGMAFYDDETIAAAQAELGRPLYSFTKQDDDPMVNNGDDARFLRNRLRDHVAALATEVRAAYPSARCEVLFPYDVNYPERLNAGRRDLGGRLNRFVNLPAEWQLKPGSGLDAMKVEALAFSTGMRNLDLVREAVGLFPGFGWPLADIRYLAPVFGSATPWNRELSLAREAGIRQLNLWAFDHICLYNLAVPEKGLERRSVVKAA